MSIPLLFAKRRFSPRNLFAAGEQGAWYDPSNFSMLFQDASGATPVTAVEQPVGLVLDNSGRANHASQSTTTSRLILRNLYNLLQYTEQFDNAYWTRNSIAAFGSGSIANATVAPDGTTTADFISETATTTSFTIRTTSVTLARPFTLSFYAKKFDRDFVVCRNDAGNGWAAWNLTTGAVAGVGDASFTTQSIQDVGNGWYKCTANYLVGGAGSGGQVNIGPQTTASFTAYAGTLNSGVYIWGAQATPLNQSSLPYQRVVTNTLGSGVYDSDLAKFPAYLRADRTDDSYTTADGGGSTTGFFFCASIILQTAGQTHTLISDTGTNTGYRVRINSSNRVELSAGNGSAYTTATTTETLSAGQRAVITAWHDGTKLYAQINNGVISEQVFGTATAGTTALTIGKDNGEALNYFGGGIYYHVYRKDKAPTDVERAKTKALCASKGGITL